MLLSADFLKDVCGVNSFEYTHGVEWTEGDALTLSFQLIDVSLDTAPQGYFPPGRRYVPASGSTLTVVIENIDDAKKVTRAATQPYAQDGSVWQVQIFATDKIRGTPQIRLTLTEPSKTTYGLIKVGKVRVHPKSNL